MSLQHRSGLEVFWGLNPNYCGKCLLGRLLIGAAWRHWRNGLSIDRLCAAARTVDEFWRALGEATDAFTPDECGNYFARADRTSNEINLL